MEYSVKKLSKLSGVSARTLRYYDEIGLLKPLRVSSSNYRIYGQNEVDLLQQILFYRELKFSLEDIKGLLTASDFDRKTALMQHLSALKAERARLDSLIQNVYDSLAEIEGEIVMKDSAKFKGFKQKMLEENEEKYGDELRERYGKDAVEKSNKHFSGITQQQFEQAEALRLELEKVLLAAFEEGDPASELAQKACDIHRQWLCIFYPSYSKQYHMGLADMYVADDRFRANYDKLAPGCTDFFRDAIYMYCDNSQA